MTRQEGNYVHNTITMVVTPMGHYMETKKPGLIMILVGVLAVLSGCVNSKNKEEVPATTILVAEVAPTTEPAMTTSTLAESAILPEMSPNLKTLTTADGRVRSYQIVDLSLGQTAPLLFILHGFGGSSQQMREYVETRDIESRISGLKPIVVYPDGVGGGTLVPQSWNAGKCCPLATIDLIDDVAFIDQLTDEISKGYNIDKGRIWVAGWSNGGMMAYRLACELSDKIDAIIVSAGVLMVDTCAPTRPVSALHIHGELDTAIPYEGGSPVGILFPSTRASVDTFAKANSCTPGESISTGTTATRPYICDKNTNIELVTGSTWTHTWVNEWTELLVDFLARRQ